MNLKNFSQLIILSCFLFCVNYKANSQVMINEYCCSNQTLPDNYGNTEDWIELYNAGGTTINLAGYYLSDKISHPLQWAFPAGITIPANGFIKVWASGDNIVVGTDIHTNFSLTQTKPEQIIFSNPGGTIIDSLTLNPTLPNNSRGRASDGSALWALFTTPTPGVSNSGAKLDYAVRPIMGYAAGFYPAAINVSISSPGVGVSIYYTTDGSTPTQLSTLYSVPVSINSTTVLRAKAFSTNPLVPASFIRSSTYFIGITHTLAVVSVFSDSIMTLMNGTQFYPETALQYFDVNKHLAAEADGNSNKHGNDSWAYAERGIDFICDDELGYNYALNTKFFTNKSRKSFSRIIIKSAANDNYPCEPHSAHIRDSYVETISQRGNLHLDCRTWEPAILYVNGQYWGVYDIREKVDDKDFTGYYYNQGDKDSLQYLMTWGATWSKYGGPQAQTDWNTLKSYITTNNMAVAANYNHVDSLLNVKSLIDYFLINSWAVTSDWLNWNTGWWHGLRPEGQEHKWRYTLWDNDATFGHYINYTSIPSQLPNADPCAPEALPDPGGQGHTLIVDSLMKNPTFKHLYVSRYIDLLNSTFSCDFSIPLLDSMISIIAPEMPAQIARWGGTVTEWQHDVDTMRTFISNRCTDITQGMRNCYSLTGPYSVNFNVSPANAGTIKINSFAPQTYSWTGSYFGNIETTLQGLANPGYVFDHWEMINHHPSPSIVNDSVGVTFVTSDNVLAVFRLPTEPMGGIQAGVPTAFSPNGDGVNDILFVLGSVQNIEFEIFNRWGQVVFHTSDRSIGWDGTFDGKPLNPGVFAYHLTGTMANGNIVDNKGNITLVR